MCTLIIAILVLPWGFGLANLCISGINVKYFFSLTDLKIYLQTELGLSLAWKSADHRAKRLTPERAKLASSLYKRPLWQVPSYKIRSQVIFFIKNPNWLEWNEYFIPQYCQFWFFCTRSADLESELKHWSIYKHVKYLLSRIFRHGPPMYVVYHSYHLLFIKMGVRMRHGSYIIFSYLWFMFWIISHEQWFWQFKLLLTLILVSKCLSTHNDNNFFILLWHYDSHL